MTAVSFRFLPLYVADPDLATREPEDWRNRALCAQVGTGPFYPDPGESTREAKRICRGCDVRAECLAYALARNELWGIYGGLSRRERVRLQRSREVEAA